MPQLRLMMLSGARRIAAPAAAAGRDAAEDQHRATHRAPLAAVAARPAQRR
jgi:hypothetical protein